MKFLLTESDLTPEVLAERKRCFDIVCALLDEERGNQFKPGKTAQQRERYAQSSMALVGAAIEIQGLGRAEITRRSEKPDEQGA